MRIYSTPLMLSRPIIMAQLGAAKVVLLEAQLAPDSTEMLSYLLVNIEQMLGSILGQLETIAFSRSQQLEKRRSKLDALRFDDMMKKMIDKLFKNLRLTAAMVYTFKELFLETAAQKPIISSS